MPVFADEPPLVCTAPNVWVYDDGEVCVIFNDEEINDIFTAWDHTDEFLRQLAIDILRGHAVSSIYPGKTGCIFKLYPSNRQRIIMGLRDVAGMFEYMCKVAAKDDYNRPIFYSYHALTRHDVATLSRYLDDNELLAEIQDDQQESEQGPWRQQDYGLYG